jgi:56kDa selenium binding protein (SBP56)
VTPTRRARPLAPWGRAALCALVAVAACGMAAESDDGPARDYLYLWTASSDSTQPDFLAVLDVTEDSARYGALVTTIAVPGLGNLPHHTEHELAADRQLFANGFAAGRSFIFDLGTPDAPRIAGEFGDVDGYSHPHSFLRLPNGNVLATFQMKHHGSARRAGGLVELTPGGALVRSSPADSPGADSGLRVYSAGIMPAIDRIVTTSTDMEKDSFEPSRTLQIWRLSDLALLMSISLPGPNGTLTAEPRLLADGRRLLVSTFSCGLFLVDGIDTGAPTATQVASFPQRKGESCAIPVIVGNHYLVTVPAWSAVVSLDISDPAAPKEVSRVAFGPEDVPHWIAVSPDQRRVVVTGYAGMRHTVQLLRFDPATGQLSLDPRFREAGASAPGFRMDDKRWPHGSSAKGVPHGAVFSRP